jgi:hypothetical protein
MRCHLRWVVLALALSTSGCKVVGSVILDLIFDQDEETEHHSHIDDEVFERKGYERDSPEGRRLQREQDNASDVERKFRYPELRYDLPE